MSSLVSRKFQEDYPESYKKDVVFESDELAAASGALATQLSEQLIEVGPPFKGLTPDQLKAEYEWLTQRLFGPAVGLEYYEATSDEFDDVFKDSVDEIASLWREKFHFRFGRDPPIDLVDYVYPRRDLDEDDRRRLRKAIDDEYHRLLQIAKQDTFLTIPKGITRRKL